MQLLNPPLDGGEAVHTGDIEDQQRRVSVSVIHGRHRTKPLLARRVPHLFKVYILNKRAKTT